MRCAIPALTCIACTTATLRGDILLTTYYESFQQQESVLAQVDPVTGAVKEIGPTGARVISSLAYDSSSDTLYGFGRRDADEIPVFLRIDIQTGATSEIGEVVDDQILGLAYDESTDTLYAASWNREVPGGSALYEVNRATGELSLIGEGPFTPYAMTWDQKRDQLLFASFAVPSQFGVYNPSSGEQAVITELGSRMAGITFDAQLDTVFALAGDDDFSGSGDRLFRIDPVTGEETLVATLSSQERYGSLVSIPIPTPATTLILAAAALCPCRHRQR